MPEYLSPGVYIEEISIGPSPIEGVSTSTAGFLGYTERGPINPVLITSFEEYKRVFGNYIPESYLAYAIEGFFRNGGRRCYVARASGKVPTTNSEGTWTFAEKNLPCGSADNNVTIKAVGPGAWGNRIFYRLTNSEIYNKVDENGVNEKDTYFNLSIFYCSKKPPPEDLKDYRKLSRLPYCMVEKYRDLCIKPSSPLYYKNQVEGISNFIRIWDDFEGKEETNLKRPDEVKDVIEGSKDEEDREDEPGLIEVFPIFTDDNEAKGVNPTDTPAESDFDGQDDLDLDNGKLIKTGFIGIANIEDISILCIPDAIQTELAKNVIDECEKKGNRFAILSTKQNGNEISTLEPIRDSKYAAQYFPWVYVFDPLTKSKKLVPPVGHLAGIYARVDNLRGVHKAPANETISGILSLQVETNTGRQDILNPRGINVIRSFPGRGYMVWGARTISRDPMWKYINVRRLFIFVEKSVERSTQWAVFEPNNERLWSRVKTSLEQFLVTVWKTGALMGTTPEEAFFVRVDRTTMTQNDIDNGRLVVVVGIAPTKPAEFVIFRFAQTQAGVKVTEI